MHNKRRLHTAARPAAKQFNSRKNLQTTSSPQASRCTLRLVAAKEAAGRTQAEATKRDERNEGASANGPIRIPASSLQNGLTRAGHPFHEHEEALLCCSRTDFNSQILVGKCLPRSTRSVLFDNSHVNFWRTLLALPFGS